MRPGYSYSQYKTAVRPESTDRAMGRVCHLTASDPPPPRKPAGRTCDVPREPAQEAEHPAGAKHLKRTYHNLVLRQFGVKYRQHGGTLREIPQSRGTSRQAGVPFQPQNLQGSASGSGEQRALRFPNADKNQHYLSSRTNDRRQQTIGHTADRVLELFRSCLFECFLRVAASRFRVCLPRTP